jgi:hypothetical protein
MKTKTKSYVYKCKGYREQNRKRVNKGLLVMTVIYCTVMSVGWAIKSYDSLLKDFNNGAGVAIVTAARAETVSTPVSEIRTLREQVTDIVKAYFPKKVDYLMKVQACENRQLDPKLCNTQKTSTGYACGLWQITDITWKEGIKRFRPLWTPEDRLDPLKNTEMAMEFIKAGELWRWECK